MPSLLGLDLNCRDGFCNPAKDNFASANQSFFRDFGERGQVTWIAVSVYVLVAIVKKRLKITASLYEILQILSLTMFEKTPLDQLLNRSVEDAILADAANQLILFE